MRPDLESVLNLLFLFQFTFFHQSVFCMFLLFLSGFIFFTTLITHYFFSFDGISITETPLRDDTAVCSSMCRPLV